MGNIIDPGVQLDIQQPIRKARSSLVKRNGELERAVELAALKARPRGAVFVLLDSDDDCPAELAPRLLDRARPAGMGLPVSVILPKREFEGWFLAAAESIRGKRGLPADLTPPQDPKEIRGAKGWLRQRMGAFWLMTLGMSAMVPALTGAGLVQVYMERMSGLPFMQVQSYLSLLYTIRFWSGAVMLVGLVAFLADVVSLKPAQQPAAVAAAV